MTTRLLSWKWWDNNIEKALIVAFYGYFCIIILTEVILRYVFSASTPWGEMTARYSFVYLVSIAVAEAARHNDHIRIDLLPRSLAPGARLLLYLYFDILHLALGALVVWYAVKVMSIQVDNGQMMQALDVNMAIAYFALPLGWGLFVYRVARRMVQSVRTYRSTGEVALGGGGLGN